MPPELATLFTPCAIVDHQKLLANVAKMRTHIESLGMDLRPHVKTTKSIEIAQLATEGFSGAITVSTLAEAAHFGLAGFRDILYGVGIAPSKLDAVAQLLSSGVDLKVILDSAATASAVAAWGEHRKLRVPVLLEINSDDHRAGLDPDSPAVVQTAQILASSDGVSFRGVMTHAGASYDCTDTEQIGALAIKERDSVVECATAIREAGIRCDTVSVGSTPTALFASNLEGVTEVRAGVYVFFDLFQAGLGVCELNEIALTVLTTVIGQKRSLNRLITDAGSLALSKDRGTAAQRIDRGYGLVCEASTGRIIDNLYVSGVNQEHGLVSTMDGSPLSFDKYPVGTQFRILPNHACMTAAAHDGYFVVNSESFSSIKQWRRVSGWSPKTSQESKP